MLVKDEKKKKNENEMLCCHLSQVKADRGTTDIAFKEKLITSACISHNLLLLWFFAVFILLSRHGCLVQNS